MPPKKSGKATPAKGKSDVVCPMCEELIIDAGSSNSKKGNSGQESIFCEGVCNAWLHRSCAGLNKITFAALVKSKEKFFCPSCRMREYQSEISKLREREWMS